jgi:GDP-4-dehydro-6-deoxy-D-mannose reductase
MSKRILVTGASGFAGGHLLDLLATADAEVFAWHRPGGTPAREVARTKWQAVDMLDSNGVRTALQAVRPGFVYHCAGAAHVGRSWTSTAATLALNVRGTHFLIEGLRAAQIDARVLIPSSATVYAPSNDPLREDHRLLPSSPYALSKLAQELVGSGNPGGPHVSIARAFNHFGPRQDPWFVASGFARRIADIEAGRWEPEMAVGNLEAQRDLTDVRDTVRAYREILERGAPGSLYNVCSGRAIVIRDLLDMLLARSRVAIAIKPDPARYRPNDQPIVVGDPTLIKKELSWAPQIPIEQTVDDLLEYWRAVAART